MTRPLFGAALMMGALATLSLATPALAVDACTDGLDRLNQQAAALEAAGPGTPAPVTPQEIAQLRALQQSAQRVAQSGNAPGCLAILAEADGLQRSIARPSAVAADDLAKAKLHGADGAELGKISELVVDPITGRVAYAVVEMGGFLGIGDAHVPVPWALFQPAANNDGYVLNVPKDRLTGAPRFAGSNRPDMGDRQWAMAVHTYYGVPPYWMRDSATLAAAGGGASTPAAAQQQEVQRLSQEVARLTGELAQARAAGATGAVPDATGQSGAPQPPAANQ
ncbi:PRC-barrel domain-containing protein [Azospirillum doebereinerae]|uniref:PRC-barrel domain containing protein n=1 Tax=Azospirillum doebereinerae TaxID=92933 RepID=A0A3S0VL74_9PROT|nr:PRC-barrel domain-containing protein [Azospirillum doebereinerae]MCG5239114.1 PRC-barrel domain-containing protein [Azospirillum doebereinerae]RUQ75690.1 PRC-barrel domain containing protein [Azospirillum doebereinerae]